MAHNFALTNNYDDLWTKILTNHISFLVEDKSLEKLKQQNQLQNHIKEFICNVSHRHKFSFAKTAEVLHRSVGGVKFNALKAAAAWLSLSAYANNLYNQPWRKEYYEIKLYSGFYMHQIENCLSGAEAILELMGYRSANGDKMVLEQPINPNQLVTTSLDALIAMCECQVLFTIFKEISKHISTITWVEILRFREMYTGTPDQLIQAIMLYSYPANFCADCCCNYPRYQSAPECRKCCQGQSSGAYGPVNGYGGTSALAYCPSANLRYQHSNRNSADHLPFANGHYHHHHPFHVPTAKLIDYEDKVDGWLAAPPPTATSSSSSLSPHRRHASTVKDRWNSTTGANYCSSSPYRHRTQQHLSNSSAESGGVSCDEDGSRTRSARDSVERGSSTVESAAVETSGSGLASAGSNCCGISGSCKRDQSVSTETSYGGKSVVKVEGAAAARSRKTSSSSDDVAAVAASGGFSTTALAAEADFPALFGDSVESAPTWECPKCTYYNPLEDGVCKMCGKSRNVSVEVPLVSGGKHCAICTLVNRRDATKCEACDSSLDGSPTYV